MTQQEKVIEIHKSNLYGFVVETGCSTALSGALMNVSGASKTVYFCKQPYSKEYERIEYGNNFDRSVSRKFVEQAIDNEVSKLDLNINFGIVSSWQISIKPGEITHGWYAIWDKKNDRYDYLHFTYPIDKVYWTITREEMLENISLLGIELLYCLIESNIQSFKNIDTKFNLDQAFGTSFNDDTNFDLLIHCMEDNKSKSPMLVFDKNNKPQRLAELIRKSSEFIVQKGSFNPLHHQHVNMMNSGLKLYPNAKPVFMISTYRYDKPHINIDELKERIKNITSYGYEVIVLKDLLFYDCFKQLIPYSDNKKFYFIMGSDTINRIIDTDIEYTKNLNLPLISFMDFLIMAYSFRFKFLVHKRMGYPINPLISNYKDMIIVDETYQDDGTSSTKIRAGEQKTF